MKRLALVLVTPVAVSCASPARSTFDEDPLLRPGARIELGEVQASPAVLAEMPEAPALMEAAMSDALAGRGILWSGEGDADRFRLEIRVADYAAGNAFKRWLLPGYGRTILAIEGRLVDLRDDSLAGVLDHRRSVAFGGAFTIGAWRTIFDSVAADVAAELGSRIGGEGFVLALDPWAARDVPVPETEHSQVFSWQAVRDSREQRGRIGERESLGVSMGHVFFARDVAGFLQETITDLLLAEGHRISASEGRPIDLEVLRFWVETDSTALYWDVEATIAVRISIGAADPERPAERIEVVAKGTERTYTWPGRKVMGKALDEAFLALVADLSAAEGWPL